MTQKITGAQRDFSAGEVDVSIKRSDDHPARKAGVRQAANWRILESGAVQNRPGRSALFPALTSGRIEELTMSAGNTFKICFGYSGGAGTILIVNSSGATVATFAALPWTLATLNLIVYALQSKSIFITFPGMRPLIVEWDGFTTWTISDFTEYVYGNQKRTPFYRLSPPGVTLVPSGTTGTVTFTASSAIFTAAHIGTRLRWVGRQVLITAVPGPYPSATFTAVVQETLNSTVSIFCYGDPRSQFSVGDTVIGATTGAKGVIASLTPTNIHVILTTGVLFANSTNPDEIIVGPAGSINSQAASFTTFPPEPTAFWDDEVMNDLRGYPASCFVDQFRLGFCNFPAIPAGICWSSISTPNDLYPGANPSDSIFEIVPDKATVYFVVPGPESSEFVLCDSKLYYIQITPTNPLRPGSVSFQVLSSDGCARVQPRATQEVVLYVNGGANSVMAVVAPGAYYRPFNTRNITEFHGHLFEGTIVALAAPTSDSKFPERYAYALMSDGSLSVGKYGVADGQIQGVVGWVPWSGVGALKWIAAWNADVLFTTSYFGATICEQLDDTVYLDANISVNSLPSAFAPAPGLGPLWWIPSQSVTLMDQQTRAMGTYSIDASGFIIPQGVGGENMAIASLVAGQSWSATLEPFAPTANPGADAHQRMTKRRIARMAVYVVDSTGFLMARLFPGPLTPTSPALGTIMNTNRVETWNQDDDATKPPPLREEMQAWRPVGRAFDPRVAIIKDTPGPLLIAEFGMEVTI